MNQALSTSLNASEDFENRIFEFLELSRKILVIVQYENGILQSSGFLTMEAYLEHRSALLKSYEVDATSLIEDMISESIQTDAKRLLVSELSTVQAALTENTVYKFDHIRNSPPLKDGDRKWH